MFTVYYANQISQQKEILIRILKDDPNPNPFAPETILVQSIGMAQWLQMQIAQELGVSGNLNFPYPTSFLWQQYRTLFPDLPKENIFCPYQYDLAFNAVNSESVNTGGIYAFSVLFRAKRSAKMLPISEQNCGFVRSISRLSPRMADSMGKG